MPDLVIARLSLNVKLPLLIAGLLIAVVTAFVAVTERVASRGALVAAGARLETVAAQVAGMLTQSIGPAIRTLRSSAADSSVRAYVSGVPGSETAARAVLLQLSRDTSPGAATEIRTALAPRLTARPASPLDSAVGAAAPLRPDSAAISPLFEYGGSIYYEVTTPIRPAGEPSWLVMRRRLGGGSGLQRLAKLVGTNAKLLLGNRHDSVWTDLGGPAPGVVAAPLRNGVYERAGEVRVGTRTPLAGTPWMLAAEFPRSSVLSEARQLARDAGLIGLIIIAVGTTLGLLLSRGLTNPLVELSNAAHLVAGGDKPALAKSAGQDEIGRLAHAFHTMVGRVKEAQDRLSASETQYRLLFDLNPNAMWVVDRSTFSFLAVNDAAVQKYKYPREEFLGMTLRDIGRPEDVQPLMEALIAGRDAERGSSSWRHLTRDGKKLDVEITGRPLRFSGREAELVLAQDVTERRTLENQLRQSQKMEAVGRLAGGVAHDFNNILTVIQTAADFLLTDLDATDARRRDAADILAAAERAGGFTRQLLAFSRQQVFELRKVDLNGLVGGMEPLLRRLVEANVAVVTHLAPDLGCIEADSSQIEQVVLNLVINARDAISGEGSILIETSNVVLDQAYPRSELLPHDGPHVVLTVTDTGCGMDAATQGRIFEPFFTTKAVGHGSGLGLSTVYGIVRQLDGQIWVYSEPGNGTTFKIYFRRYEGAGDPPALPATAAPRTGRGGQTILLVEDDAAVRSAVRRVLERHHYRVIEAPGGAEVIELVAAGQTPVDLVLSDMVMPGMSGLELRERLREMGAPVPLLLMSGYSEEAITRLAHREVLGPLIEKPFTVDGILGKIEEVLGGTGHG